MRLPVHAVWLSGVLAISLSATVEAQPANQRAEKEAVSYLKPCHEATPARQGLCEQNQSNFVEQYVYAKAGDTLAMGSTASSFDPRADRQDRLGIPADAIQSCAWRLVRLDRQKDAMTEAMVHSACTPLPAADRAAAVRQGVALAEELDAQPAAMPSAAWYPHIPWIKRTPSAPIDRSKLDHTAVPLKAD